VSLATVRASGREGPREVSDNVTRGSLTIPKCFRINFYRSEKRMILQILLLKCHHCNGISLEPCSA